jgi:hypothetical protein
MAFGLINPNENPQPDLGLIPAEIGQTILAMRW